MVKPILYFILALALLSCESRKQADQPQEPIATTKETNDTATIPAPSKPAPTAVKPKPDSTYLIVPGKSIGQISLDETAEKVHSKLGQPDSGDAAMGKALSFWINPDERKVRQYVAVYFVRNTKGTSEAMLAEQIQVSSPAFKTKGGLSTGSKLSNIRKEFKLQPKGYYTNERQKQVYVYDDPEQGITFEVTTPDSTCTAIAIHKKGETISKTYLPIHPETVWLEE